MKLPIPFALVIVCIIAVLCGCTTNTNRANLNAADSIVSAVNLAEKVWAGHVVTAAKNSLIAEGITAPTSAQLRERVNQNPNVAKVTELDVKYRAAMAAYVKANEAYAALKAAGQAGALDTTFRDAAIAAANDLITAVTLITGQTLNPAK